MIKTRFGFGGTAASRSDADRYAVDLDNGARLWAYSETLLAKV